MRYHFKIHKDGKGYWAQCLEIDGILTDGRTMKELKENMEEALNLHMMEPEKSNVVFPPPDPSLKGKNIAEVKPRPGIIFSNELRRIRKNRNLTQIQVKNLLGLEHLTAYQRLENPKTTNPKLSSLTHVKEVFPELSLERIIG